MRRRILLLALVALVGAGAWAFRYAWQTAEATTRAILHPKNEHFEAPSIPEDVDHVFRVQRGEVELDVWVLDPRAPHPEGGVDTVFVLHGIADQKRSLYGLARRYSLGGLRSVLVDFRGHGLSSTVPLTFGAEETADLSAVLDGLEARGLETGSVGVYGASYGAGIALQWSGTEPRVDRVLAAAGFASLAQLQQSFLRIEGVPFRPPRWFARAVTQHVANDVPFNVDDASGEARVGAGHAEIVLLHSPVDDVVPYENAEAIVARCPGRCRLVTLEDLDHVASMSNVPLRLESYRLMTGETYPGSAELNGRYRAFLRAQEAASSEEREQGDESVVGEVGQATP